MNENSNGGTMEAGLLVVITCGTAIAFFLKLGGII